MCRDDLELLDELSRQLLYRLWSSAKGILVCVSSKVNAHAALKKSVAVSGTQSSFIAAANTVSDVAQLVTEATVFSKYVNQPTFLQVEFGSLDQQAMIALSAKVTIVFVCDMCLLCRCSWRMM